MQATERFLRVATDLVVEACLKSGRAPAPPVDDKTKNSARQLNYTVVDPYSKLLVILVSIALKAYAGFCARGSGLLSAIQKCGFRNPRWMCSGGCTDLLTTRRLRDGGVSVRRKKALALFCLSARLALRVSLCLAKYVGLASEDPSRWGFC